MKKLQYKTKINAPAQQVYQTMLGLDDIKTYENWTAVFNPSSTYEGSWDKGSKIYFVGPDENGKRRGMVSEIAENRPADFVSIRHYGFVDGDEEITTGEMVESWAGGHENYTFTEENGKTLVTVDLDSVEDFVGYFDEKYPAALEKLKLAIENSN